ncbi:RidA family protein [Kineococcus rhizosphaerae]|uniref:Enamine deaminase RidA (YjgF/YER057c/UK114 family) n=1 Tax=Kineococcus rhizosphaerae TaxID=559628 RepID=A0A2T0QRA7_9ACTN|nr:Rid family hydrolase [Kineococcus rhizosphaerae]PRY07347.1 enamine deaminase RidA (YjgF/YER057c/UK114 family) [Kineococcus rhizosphaerae]
MTTFTSSYNHDVPWEASFGYSQGYRVGNTIYISGQLAHDEACNLVGEGDIAAQCLKTFENFDTVLLGLGGRRDQVVETTVAIIGLRENFDAVSAAHLNYFGHHRPASTALGVVELAMPGQLVEVAAVARLDI